VPLLRIEHSRRCRDDPARAYIYEPYTTFVGGCITTSLAHNSFADTVGYVGQKLVDQRIVGQQIYFDANGNQVLDDLVVRRKADLPNVVLENDGTITPINLNFETVLAALKAGDGVAINFDLAFAPRTKVLTAEGKHVVEVISNAMKYLASGMMFEIHARSIVADAHHSQSLSDNRMQALIARLSHRFAGKHSFEGISDNVRLAAKTKVSSSSRADLWSFTIVNTGASLQARH